MEPSSPNQKNLQPAPRATELTELSRIRESLANLAATATRQEECQRKLSHAVVDIARLLEGFTSGGASFQAYQVSPMVLVYAAILGPILGDRIDGMRPKTGEYIDEMTKGAAVMAQQLLRTLDQYQGERGFLDYLENTCADLSPPEPPTPKS
jgi:hypothetical protein